MENKLKKLFDYQKFESNPRLARMINKAELYYGSQLSDEDLSEVSAAGQTQMFHPYDSENAGTQTKLPGSNTSDTNKQTKL